MVTTVIGNMFLEAYNEKFKTSYDTKTFFVEKFHKMFFDHDKHMMYVTNSPFVQKLPKEESCILGKLKFESKEKRQQRLTTLLDKIQSNRADSSIAVGYPASDIFRDSSSQVPDIKRITSEGEMYASWIGAAFGVNVSGITTFFFDKEILIDIYEGWKWYRKALDETKLLKGKQINSWNAHWLIYRYDALDYDSEENPMDNMDCIEENKGLLRIKSIPWTLLFIKLAEKKQEDQIMTYLCRLGKMNETFGFVQFYLKQILRPIEMYVFLFGMNNVKEAEVLWGTEIGFEVACGAGVIGVKAMQPKGLQEFLTPEKGKKVLNEKNKINYQTYISFIMAMLNDKELFRKTQKLVKLLQQVSVNEAGSISTKKYNLVKNLLNSKTKVQFLDSVSNISPYVEDKDILRDCIEDVTCMSKENLMLFFSLLRVQFDLV